MNAWRAKGKQWITRQWITQEREDGQALAEVSVILAFILAISIATLGVLGIAVLAGLDSVIDQAFP